MATLQSPRYLPWTPNFSGTYPIPIDTKTGKNALLAQDYLEEEVAYGFGDGPVIAVAIATVFEWGNHQLETLFELSEEQEINTFEKVLLEGGWLTDASLQSLKAYFYESTPEERFGVAWNLDFAPFGELLEEAAAYLLWLGDRLDDSTPSFLMRDVGAEDLERDRQLQRCLLEGGKSHEGHYILNRWLNLNRFVEASGDGEATDSGELSIGAEEPPSQISQSSRPLSERFWKAREGVYLEGVNPGPDRSQNYSYWRAAGELGQDGVAEVIWRSIPERLYGLSMTEDDKLRWALEPEMEERANRRFYFAFASENRFWPEHKVRNWLLYAFFRDVGIPVSQVLNLQVSDVNFETCTVPVMNKRSGERSFRPLPDHVVDGLRAYLDGPWSRVISRVGSDGDGPLFTVNSGGPLAQGYLDTFLRSTGEAEIGKRVKPSTLVDTWRHEQLQSLSGASLLLN